MGRRNLSKKLEILSEQQGHRCCYCGVAFVRLVLGVSHPHAPTIEHVKRLADGGAKSWDNEVVACKFCNNSRGETEAEAWYLTRSVEGPFQLEPRPTQKTTKHKPGTAKWKRLKSLKEAAALNANLPEPNFESRWFYFSMAYRPQTATQWAATALERGSPYKPSRTIRQTPSARGS
jgi:hypothetical protein